MISKRSFLLSLVVVASLTLPDAAQGARATSYDQDQIRPRQQQLKSKTTQSQQTRTTSSGSRGSDADFQIDAAHQGSQYYREQQGILMQAPPGRGGGASYKPPMHK